MQINSSCAFLLFGRISLVPGFCRLWFDIWSNVCWASITFSPPVGQSWIYVYESNLKKKKKQCPCNKMRPTTLVSVVLDILPYWIRYSVSRENLTSHRCFREFSEQAWQNLCIQCNFYKFIPRITWHRQVGEVRRLGCANSLFLLWSHEMKRPCLQTQMDTCLMLYAAARVSQGASYSWGSHVVGLKFIFTPAWWLFLGLVTLGWLLCFGAVFRAI